MITFPDAGDEVDLPGFDAGTGTLGNQALTLVRRFTGPAGQAVVHFHSGQNLTTLDTDVDSDGVADRRILLSGDQTGFSNFVL